MKVITNWRKATEALAKVFTKKYFPDEVYGKDTFWVGDEIGGVFSVSDYFFDVNRMIECLELNATFEQLSDYYYDSLDYCMENPDKPMHTSYKNYLKYGYVGKPDKVKK